MKRLFKCIETEKNVGKGKLFWFTPTSKSYSAVNEARSVLTTGIEPTKTSPNVKAFKRTDTVMPDKASFYLRLQEKDERGSPCRLLVANKSLFYLKHFTVS